VGSRTGLNTVAKSQAKSEFTAKRETFLTQLDFVLVILETIDYCIL